jgi:cytochrome c556
VQKAAQTLTSAAEDLVKFADADDKASVEAQIPKLFAACGACHGQFRGQLP